jgi:hypothetical protein
LKIESLKKHIIAKDYNFTIHALERCVERNISPEEIREVILSGEVIEEYPEHRYGPCCLIYGITGEGRILHVQCSIEPVWIITAYDPTINPEEWEDNFKRRKRKE